MAKNNNDDSTLSIEERSLIHMISIAKELEKAGYSLTDPNGELNKELIINLIKAKEEIERENEEELTAGINKIKIVKIKENKKKKDNIFKKLLKKIYKENDEIIKKNNKKDKNIRYDSRTEALEREMVAAVIELKSRSSVDSDENDLRILENMAKIVMLTSELSMKDVKTMEMGNRAIKNIALTTGGASLDGAVTRQALKTNPKPLTESLRVNLDKATSEVDINTLPTTDSAKQAKEEKNKQYAEQMAYWRKKENYNG